MLGCEGYFGTMTFEGTSGIIVKNNLNINFLPIKSSGVNQTKLTVKAGCLAISFATNSPNGVAGTAGSAGKSSSKNGENGSNGGNGSDGRNGQKGIAGINCGILKVAGTGSFIVTGGAGGNGGNGGRGGDGYNESKWFTSGGNGGNGGNGGYGGKGGNGGKGGAAIRCTSYEATATVNALLSGGDGGEAGTGGKGGARGTGGAKGSCGFWGGSTSDGNSGTDRTNTQAANGVSGTVGGKIEYK